MYKSVGMTGKEKREEDGEEEEEGEEMLFSEVEKVVETE